jgi:DNA-directed RNA polymerase specialized sigma24 family protein
VRRYKNASGGEKEELFNRICSIIQPTIRSCVRRYYAWLKSSEKWRYKEEEDVILETYEHIAERGAIDRYEGRDGASFQTYVYGIARRYLVGEVRKGKSGREGEREKGRIGMPPLGGGGGETSEETAKALRGCVEGLSVRERILIALFYYYREPAWGRNMTDEDVLELLEIIAPPLAGKERPLKSAQGVST